MQVLCESLDPFRATKMARVRLERAVDAASRSRSEKAAIQVHIAVAEPVKAMHEEQIRRQPKIVGVHHVGAGEVVPVRREPAEQRRVSVERLAVVAQGHASLDGDGH